MAALIPVPAGKAGFPQHIIAYGINKSQILGQRHEIVWIQEIIKLKYLITQLEQYVTCPKGFTKWQITCAHFSIRVKRGENVDNKTSELYIIKDLKPSQFSRGGKVPSKVDDLDKKIRILDPKTNYNEALQEYLDAKLERDEIKDTEDALANGLNTDTRI